MATGDIVKTYRSREEIACEINIIKANVLRTALQGAIDVGRLLCEAKDVVPHGEWGAWLEENVSYSTTTANDLMRLYREYNDDQVKLFGRTNEELYGRLSVSQALALLALPQPEREEFVAAHDMDELSVRELREEIGALKEELEKQANDLREAEMQRDAGKQLADAAENRIKAAEANADRMVKQAEQREKKAADALAKAQKEAERAKKDADAARAKLETEKKKVEQLQIELDEKPEPEVVEKIVEQLPADYQMLKEDNAILEKQLQMADPMVAKCGVYLEEIQLAYTGFDSCCDNVKLPDMRQKLREAMKRVVGSWGIAAVSGGAAESEWQRTDSEHVLCMACGKHQLCFEEDNEQTTAHCPECGVKMRNGGKVV